MVVHWDDVEAEELEAGDLHGRFRDLGTAAGSFRAGVMLVDLPPGGRASPLHVHADEEELFYVLEGAGFVALGDVFHHVAAGDCLLFRVHEEPHALLAGRGPLSFLAFGPRAETNITYLPRAGMVRVGPHWVPPEAPSPYEVEALAGPLVVDPLVEERPTTIRPLADIPASELHRGRTRQKVRMIGDALGAETTGMRHVRIAPGARGAPHHCHGAEEELFVVLGGEGVVRLGEERHPVHRGSVLARPPGTGVAHSFEAGATGLELLGWGARVPNDIVFYPDSGKVFLRGIGVIGRLEPADPWDGE